MFKSCTRPKPQTYDGLETDTYNSYYSTKPAAKPLPAAPKPSAPSAPRVQYHSPPTTKQRPAKDRGSGFVMVPNLQQCEDEKKESPLLAPMPAPKTVFRSVEEELEFLRKENQQLRTLVKGRRERVSLEKSRAKAEEIATPYTLSQKVQEKLLEPGFLEKYDWKRTKETLILDESNAKGEVGVVDTRQIEWWTLVQKPESITENANDITYNGKGKLIGGAYVLLSESDVVEAVAVFVAQCVLRMPETSELSHKELVELLDGTFAQLRKKGFLRQAWDWGNFIYSAVSWSAAAYEVFLEPAVAKMIVSGMLSSASWLGIAVPVFKAAKATASVVSKGATVLV